MDKFTLVQNRERIGFFQLAGSLPKFFLSKIDVPAVFIDWSKRWPTNTALKGSCQKIMNSLSQKHPLEPISLLEAKHFLALQSPRDWQDIWELFYTDPWFVKRLNALARVCLKRTGFKSHCLDDVKQEALIIFANAIQRDPSLGFDRSRGSYSAFLSTVLRRCCQKGLRQFKNQISLSFDDELFHPAYEALSQFESSMDLKYFIRRIPEPYRSTLRQRCDGLTVAEIAKKRKCTKRTVYRWIGKGVALIQKQTKEIEDRLP